MWIAPRVTSAHAKTHKHMFLILSVRPEIYKPQLEHERFGVSLMVATPMGINKSRIGDGFFTALIQAKAKVVSS